MLSSTMRVWRGIIILPLVIVGISGCSIPPYQQPEIQKPPVLCPAELADKQYAKFKWPVKTKEKGPMPPSVVVHINELLMTAKFVDFGMAPYFVTPALMIYTAGDGHVKGRFHHVAVFADPEGELFGEVWVEASWNGDYERLETDDHQLALAIYQAVLGWYGPLKE